MLVTLEGMKVVSINIDFLKRAYFVFDESVPYILKDKNKIFIKPIMLKDSEIFSASVDILRVDKNSSSSIEIIQMPYLQFICDCLMNEEKTGEWNKQKFINIMSMCLGLNNIYMYRDERNRPILVDKEKNITISCKDFDDIKDIILYQNFIHYDNTYISPDFQKIMNETYELKTKNLELPSLERKMAIITIRTGLTKKEQMEMTLRSHDLLFEEVENEIEFVSVYPIAWYVGKQNEVNHWIHKKKSNKFEEYVTDVDKYAHSMGSDKNAIKSSNTGLGEFYEQQIKNFNN